MPDPDPNSMEGEAGREGGDDNKIVVPIVTPESVRWLWRLIPQLRRWRLRRKEKKAK